MTDAHEARVEAAARVMYDEFTGLVADAWERDASSIEVVNKTVVLDGRDENVLYLVFDRGEWKLVESSNIVFKEVPRV